MERMPFGKFKGRRLADLPAEYLDWLYSLETLYAPTARAVEAEWLRRHAGRSTNNGAWQASRHGPIPAAAQAAATQVVQEGYRALTRKWHPDVGGDAERMRALNVAVDWLRARIGA
jgi:hypothetical protein